MPNLPGRRTTFCLPNKLWAHVLYWVLCPLLAYIASVSWLCPLPVLSEKRASPQKHYSLCPVQAHSELPVSIVALLPRYSVAIVLHAVAAVSNACAIDCAASRTPRILANSITGGPPTSCRGMAGVSGAKCGGDARYSFPGSGHPRRRGLQRQVWRSATRGTTCDAVHRCAG